MVNKYIGETERNLDRVLARAEELDIVLLLDEGDALMTRRTEVATANDRYANLETNFLLQRLETFDGIVVVTSNAAGRIDPAFLRRIDVTVDFVPPDAAHAARSGTPTCPGPRAARRAARRGRPSLRPDRRSDPQCRHPRVARLDRRRRAPQLRAPPRGSTSGVRRSGASYPMGQPVLNGNGVHVPAW